MNAVWFLSTQLKDEKSEGLSFISIMRLSALIDNGKAGKGGYVVISYQSYDRTGGKGIRLD